ncbi:hypothetical protein CYMTET_28952 [Cymbomonas tetramitiformis]|uniref:Reverse transcriptase domain-containing protein n=1 Tax=Cymbomonas tetramitiformis TaxID=36881 RepID=A0AAE0FLU7_9CHLO|nr:hypothetical protein CYMTET_28952 [Cymbomonas tetramitiformis]
MEGVSMIPQILETGDPAFVMDQANGFFHVKITAASQKYMGFLWDGVYYVYTALNFGWKLAPFVYSAFAGEFAGFIRRLGIPYLYYIDDNTGGPAPVGTSTLSKQDRAAISTFVVSSCMTAAGYFIHLEKTQFIASRTFIWLGIGVDLAEGKFFIPEKQWTKFLKLVADLKASPAITTRDLERMAGKLVSMSVAAPGILIACRKLYSFLGQRDNFSRFGLYLNAKQVATFKAFLKQLDLFPLVTTSKFRKQAHYSILVEAYEPLNIVSAYISAGNFHTTLVRHTDLKNLSSTDQSFLIANILFDIPLCKVPQRWDLILDRNFWDCPRVLSSNLGKTVCKDLAKQLYTFVSHNNLDLKVVSFKKAADGSVIIPDEESHYSLLPKFSPLLSQEFGAHHFDCFATTANVRGSPG